MQCILPRHVLAAHTFILLCYTAFIERKRALLIVYVQTFASLMHKFLFQLCERKKHPVAPRSLIADRILTQLTWLHADVFSVFCSSHWLILYKAKRTTQIENQLAPVIFVNLHKLKASCHLLELSCQNQTKQYRIRRCHK